ncbi:DUF1127 domain-containing protein [Pseudoruegeria sp. SK021]|uniref:DUF1127 domain-containing protein n=1 Tax=Pseudoruegeria sp. SK021 TaxID=1933035 RepID=UPI000A233FC0|nr:DUF1127 domain-containing protein [Pseudoruegeria sp. SK021]OSP55198.1 hypothetical protein BV911_09225 [Pseudoruegeria sp. SK021]
MTSYANPIHTSYAPARHTSVLRTIYRAALNWRDVRETRKVLSRLTDRELNDIGLDRSQIDDVAQFPYR